MDQFLLFGDSITQQSFSQDRGFAFGAALADTYIRRLQVVNLGLSGYNTRQALEVIHKVVPDAGEGRGNVRFMTFFFGANDARLPDTPGGPQQHVPLGEYEENLRKLVTHPSVLAHEDVRRILITPPPVDERKCLTNDISKTPPLPDVVRRKSSDVKKYAQTVRDLGKELEIPVLDVWTAMITRAGGQPDHAEPLGAFSVERNEILQSFVHDGLHLSGAGYKVLFEEMMELIGRVWPDQMPERLPFVLPAWDDVRVWEKEKGASL